MLQLVCAMAVMASPGHGTPVSHVDTEDLYTPKPSIKARWPHLEEGVQMLDRIFDLYAFQRNANIKFFDEESRPQIVPHADNLRQHRQILAKYVQKVRKFGVVEGVRGQAWAVLSAEGRGPFRMLSWGTLSRAVYEAHRIDPTNPNVQKTLENGLRNVVLLHHRTPKDITDFLRDFHNRWHGGADKSFTDLVAEVPQLHAGWQAFCASRGLTSRSCGTGAESYTARNWAWLQQNYKDLFPSNNVYESARALSNFLVTRKWHDPFKNFVDGITLFDDPKLSNSTAIFVMHEYAVILQRIEDSVDPELLQLIFLEGVRFMVPCCTLGVCSATVVYHLCAMCDLHV